MSASGRPDRPILAPSDQAEADPGEWLTVPEAARALGVPERTVRRYAAKLADGQKMAVAGGRMLYSLTSLREILSSASQNRPVAGHRPDRPHRPSVAAAMADALQRAAVAEARAELLERERDDWQAQARAAQETASKLADRIADADARLASILAATRQIEPAQKPSNTHENAQEPQEGASGPVEGKSSDPSSPPRKRWWWPFGTGAGA